MYILPFLEFTYTEECILFSRILMVDSVLRLVGQLLEETGCFRR